MREDPRRELGREGEEHAREHLERLGYAVVERNYRTRFGEIDVIALDGSTLVFCEVKTRRADRGEPFDSLHDRKRMQVRRMAKEWLALEDRPRAPYLRFDAIGVTIGRDGRLMRLDHIEAAF
jgi:putative endonuclease